MAEEIVMITLTTLEDVYQHFPQARKGKYSDPPFNAELLAEVGELRFKQSPVPCSLCGGSRRILRDYGYIPCPDCGDEWREPC
jgi:hypothetical protein